MASHLIVGSPKTTQKIAAELFPIPLGNHPDCLIINEDTSLKIEQVRNVKHFLTRKPYQYDHQIILIVDAHKLTIPAQNALLKTLEEPPKHAVIILTSAYPDKLLPTIISRCTIHQPNYEKSLPHDTDSFHQITLNVKTLKVGQKMSLAGEYAYPKTKAIGLCQQALHYFHQQLAGNPNPNLAHNATLAQKTLTRLESNVDPKLSLEHFFINLLV